MKKKGFTLVELLAVIVILGVLLTVVGSMVIQQRKKANIQEAQKLESILENFGPDVYMAEGPGTFYLENLTKHGLKSSQIKNPNGKGFCEGYLEIRDSDDLVFKGHICCPEVYETDSDEAPSSCGGYSNIEDEDES